MDRSPLREGGVVRIWTSALGGEVLYEADLPACCQRDAHAAGDSYECVSCGAAWREASAPEPEECAFVEGGTRERKGAA